MLYHLTLPEDWAAAQAAGRYAVSTRGRTLEDEGYIHCSFADQVAATAARFYGDLAEVVLLHVDEAVLSSPVVVEDLVGAGHPFPHVYGPIDLAAVVTARRVDPNAMAI
ncbi:MAG: DUF952 domain-containing protein [Ilumatobacteraceae bacterium]